MINPGVHTLARHAMRPDMWTAVTLRDVLRRFGPHGDARCIPVAEYREACRSGNAEIQHEFFQSLVLRNGVYKATLPNRMNDLFPMLVRLASDLERLPLRVLDVACSSGISTVEMHRAFSAAGIPCEAWGTDLMISARHVRRVDGCNLLFDADQQVIQIEVGGWASPWRFRPRDLVLRPHFYALARRLMREDVRRFRVALHEPLAGYALSSVSLISPEAEDVPGVHFHEEDILRPTLTGSFAIIRAANILNLGYFGSDTIRRMVQALSARLIEGGLLLVTRTGSDRPTNRGTMFRRVGNQLRVEQHAGGGSEITDLVT
ncbi:MAG: hypothetical protein HYR73_04010 [Candidatus Eisenbacteria bacterium]|nr:hypothetical protein [Candidatus Eisenbacteria bacterium]